MIKKGFFHNYEPNFYFKENIKPTFIGKEDEPYSRNETANVKEESVSTIQVSKDAQLTFNRKLFTISQNNGEDIDMIFLTVKDAKKLAFEIEQMIRVNKALGNL